MTQMSSARAALLTFVKSLATSCKELGTACLGCCFLVLHFDTGVNVSLLPAAVWGLVIRFSCSDGKLFQRPCFVPIFLWREAAVQ